MASDAPLPTPDAKTVFQPSLSPPAAPVDPTPPPPASSPPPVEAAAPEPSRLAAPPTGRVEVGSVLNNIYEIRRFIARGGMGEVFEGVNVNDEHDRVAIKVMLPALAADPNVQAMFRKEARTLTRLSHPAVVQYRVLAQEPQLGVFYIVTEFIDGRSLADQLSELRPDAAQLRGLTRRLAEGLRAAHELGAVHRDMAPDNVLLPEGRIERAKIIDFGIAKDLDPSKATIVGDGFAGKLGFVAPEQFGDFGREVGPWTDVYSLGLVILSVAQGRNVDMGATLVEAVDKRRAGPDLSGASVEIRAVLERMLVADPAKRLRSMDEVLAALDAPVAPAPLAGEAKTVFMPSAALAATTPPPPRPAKSDGPTRAAFDPKALVPADLAAWAKGPGRMPLLLGGAGAAVVLLAAGVIALTTGGSHPAKPVAVAPGAAAAGAPASEAVRRAVAAALPGVPCSWLALDSVRDDPSGVVLRLKGVAGDIVKAHAAVEAAANGAGATVKDIAFDVAPLKDPNICSRLDAFNAVRADTSQGGAMTTAQTSYELRTTSDDPKPKAHPVVTVAIRDPKLDFVVAGLDATGQLGVAVSRDSFPGLLRDHPEAVSRLGENTYRLGGDVYDAQDWFGTLLVTGRDPMPAALFTLQPGESGEAWAQRFKAAAARGGWKAEMVWYKVVKPTQ